MGAWLSRRKVIFLDLDNTVYDWVSYFAPALRGLCRKLSEMTGLSTATLCDEFKAVFAKHGTVEYSFALQELPSLIAMHPEMSGVQLVARYRSAIEVFQHRRRAYLRPYPGVREGLMTLRDAGFSIVGVTDSRRFQAANRLRQLRLDKAFDVLCCMPDHATPDPEAIAAIRREEASYYTADIRQVIELPLGLRKPSPVILDYIVSTLSVEYEACFYVGDSLPKDIAMAQAAGIYDCWAWYGTQVSALHTGMLVRVTDWPPRAVRAALNPSPERIGVFPSYTAKSFTQVVEHAVMDPRQRPAKRVPASPARQLSLLLEFGPTLEVA